MRLEEGMRRALAEARLASREGDTPVGAAVYEDGRLVAASRNTCRASGDPTRHAEIDALRAALSRGADMRSCVLFSTREPCLMCAGAIMLSRVSRLVYGCDDASGGAAGSVTHMLAGRRTVITAGILGEECAEVLRDFYRGVREGAEEENDIP